MRWENCTAHRGIEADAFFEDFFRNGNRVVQLIGGAGFDPRALQIPQKLVRLLGKRLRAIFLRETRPDSREPLAKRASANVESLLRAISGANVVEVRFSRLTLR